MESQLAETRAQIADVQSSRGAQQLYEVMTMLLDIQAHVERVLTLNGRGMQDWTEEETASARMVASKMHLTGLLVLQKIVPEELFSHAWFYSVPRCYKILLPFIQKMREERDPRYWSAFDALEATVSHHAASFVGFQKSPSPAGSQDSQH